MKAAAYFVNLLSAAPPGIAPLRLPYAPFGQSRGIDAALAHLAAPVGEDEEPHATHRSGHLGQPRTLYDPVAAATAAPLPISNAAAAPNGAPLDGVTGDAGVAAALAGQTAESRPLRAFHPSGSARDWQVAPVLRNAPPAAPAAMPPGPSVDRPPVPASESQVQPPTPRHAAAVAAGIPARRNDGPAPAPPPYAHAYRPAPQPAHAAAATRVEIEHIEVRLLPPTPPARPHPGSGASAGPARLVRLAPPFGLRQS